jgi:peroxiredoxin
MRGRRWMTAAVMALAFLGGVYVVVRTLEPTGPPATQAASIGEAAPDFALPSLNGAIINIRHLSRRPMVINFWASWCPYCRDETQSLIQLDNTCGSRVHILGVAVAEATPEVARYAQETDIPYPILLDPTGEVANRYGASFLPTTVFVNRHGRIAYVERGPLVTGTAAARLVDRVFPGTCPVQALRHG